MKPVLRRLFTAAIVASVSVSWLVFFRLGGLGFFPRVGVTVATVLGSALIALWVLRRLGLVDPGAGSLRALFAGVVSPGLAAMLGLLTYVLLTRSTESADADFVPRLVTTALAMTVPFVATLVVAAIDRRNQPLGTTGKVGIALALVSLGFTWFPINGLLARQRQADDLALSDVAAPPFDTVDIHGEPHRLSDHNGKVVLVNIWATWCGPCRTEMPELERLYQSRKDDGLMVFGISTEDAELQQRFAQDLPVTYPLLTVQGDVPEIYLQTGRYPANLLIDRNGMLQSAPSVEEPFSSLEAAVEALLATPVKSP